METLRVFYESLSLSWAITQHRQLLHCSKKKQSILIDAYQLGQATCAPNPLNFQQGNIWSQIHFLSACQRGKKHSFLVASMCYLSVTSERVKLWLILQTMCMYVTPHPQKKYLVKNGGRDVKKMVEKSLISFQSKLKENLPVACDYLTHS